MDPLSVAMLISAVVGAGTALYSATKAPPKVPKPPRQPRQPESPDLVAEGGRRRRAAGIGATILTGGQGAMAPAGILGGKALLGQ